MIQKLLAFIHVFVESHQMDDVINSLLNIENVEELHEVTGEFDLAVVISASDIEELRDVLKNKIMKVKGVKSTVSSIVMKTRKGPRCSAEAPATAQISSNTTENI